MSSLQPEILLLLGKGLGMTILVTLISTVLSLVLGIAVGSLRLSPRAFFARGAGVYVELFRNVPALVLIIFFAFAVPNLFPQEFRQTIFFKNGIVAWISDLTGLSLPYYAMAATVALSLNTSAYLAELFRSGVSTLPVEMVDTARSLGASPAHAYWQILLPQGMRAAFPAVSTRLIHNMKNSALAALVSVPEYFQATQIAISRTFQALEFLVIAAVVYWILSFLFSVLLSQIDRRLNLVKF